MVQLLLRTAEGRFLRIGAKLACILILLAVPSLASRSRKKRRSEPAPPGSVARGRSQAHYERSFSSEKEVEGKRGFFTKLVDVVVGRAGPSASWCVLTAWRWTRGAAPSSPIRGRMAFTSSISQKQKYKFIERRDKDKDADACRRNASPWTRRTIFTSPIRSRERSSSSIRAESSGARSAA